MRPPAHAASYAAPRGKAALPPRAQRLLYAAAATVLPFSPVTPDSAGLPGSVGMGSAVGLPGPMELSGSIGPAAGAASSAAPAVNVPAFSWGGYFMAVGVMFLILAALWFAVRYLRGKGRIGGGPFGPFGRLSRFAMFSGGQDLQVEARQPLGPKKDLVLVRFLNKRLLLGVTDHHISLLQTEELNQEDSEGNDFTSTEHDDLPAGEGLFGKFLARRLHSGHTQAHTPQQEQDSPTERDAGHNPASQPGHAPKACPEHGKNA